MSGPGWRLLAGASGLLAALVAVQACGDALSDDSPSDAPPALPAPTVLLLPSPSVVGTVSVEEALARRRSVRAFDPRPLAIAQVGQLLWAAQGITDPQGRRTSPSAGALYPLEVYAITRDGVSRYVAAEHALAPVRDGDLRPALEAAALDQAAVGDAPLVIAIVGVPSRTAARYGPERATRYVQLEAGHAAQNILLQAVALALGAVPVGAFDDTRVAAVLGLPPDQVPLYLVPVGFPAAGDEPSASPAGSGTPVGRSVGRPDSPTHPA